MSMSTTRNGGLYRMLLATAAIMVGLTLLLAAIAWLMGGISGTRQTRAIGAEEKAAIAARVAPFGMLNVAGSSPDAPPSAPDVRPAAAPADGKATYDSDCAACHTTGVAGAPKLGDAASWKTRLAQGKDTLYQHAINGFQGKSGMMPAKGGNAALSDAAVKAAVDHILAGSQ